jgi:hemoglobin
VCGVDARGDGPPAAPEPASVSVDPVSDGPPTILEWAGGRDAFARWLNRFYDLVEQEAPDIAALFGGTVSAEHRVHVTDWWAEVMGGPAVYSEQRGGYEHMLARHHELAITPDQRLRFVTLLSRAADDAQLPADPEFRAAIMGYAEWGSRLALHNSQPGAQTAAHAPVPHWGWGVAPPYRPDPAGGS